MAAREPPSLRPPVLIVQPKRMAGPLAVDQAFRTYALKSGTQSRTTCSVTPPASAASVRLAPS